MPLVELLNHVSGILRADEDERLIPYLDHKGNWTVGVGHKLIAPISKSVSDALFRDDLIEAYDDAFVLVPDLHTHSLERQSVLVEMAFNLGRSGLKGFKKMLVAFQERKYDMASDEIVDSAAWRDPALQPRYQRFADRMREG